MDVVTLCKYQSIKRLRDGTLYRCQRCQHERISQRPAEQLHRHCKTLGPGLHLHRIIEKLTGCKPDRKCRCEDRIRQIDDWGVDGCREHLEEIVDWLVEQAKKHQWTLRVPGIGMLARHVSEGVQRWSCRQLVLLAIRRAERKSPL